MLWCRPPGLHGHCLGGAAVGRTAACGCCAVCYSICNTVHWLCTGCWATHATCGQGRTKKERRLMVSKGFSWWDKVRWGVGPIAGCHALCHARPCMHAAHDSCSPCTHASCPHGGSHWLEALWPRAVACCQTVVTAVTVSQPWLGLAGHVLGYWSLPQQFMASASLMVPGLSRWWAPCCSTCCQTAAFTVAQSWLGLAGCVLGCLPV